MAFPPIIQSILCDLGLPWETIIKKNAPCAIQTSYDNKRDSY